MTPVTTTMSGSNVRISWTLPSDGAAAITSYRILIQHSDGSTLSQQINYCDGTSFVIIANRFCEIPMSVLTSSPFSLSQGMLIKATVYAINQIGSGSQSSFNSVGELAQVPPHKPITPPTRNAATS